MGEFDPKQNEYERVPVNKQKTVGCFDKIILFNYIIIHI